MKCQKCGAELRVGNVFCTTCGCKQLGKMPSIYYVVILIIMGILKAISYNLRIGIWIDDFTAIIFIILNASIAFCTLASLSAIPSKHTVICIIASDIMACIVRLGLYVVSGMEIATLMKCLQEWGKSLLCMLLYWALIWICLYLQRKRKCKVQVSGVILFTMFEILQTVFLFNINNVVIRGEKMILLGLKNREYIKVFDGVFCRAPYGQIKVGYYMYDNYMKGYSRTDFIFFCILLFILPLLVRIIGAYWGNKINKRVVANYNIK